MTNLRQKQAAMMLFALFGMWLMDTSSLPGILPDTYNSHSLTLRPGTVFSSN